MAYPRFQRARSFKKAYRASTSLSYSLTTWGDVDTALDLILPAQVGDVIEAQANGLWSNEAAKAFLDVVTIVSATPVNSFATQGAISTTGGGVQAWYGDASRLDPFGGGAVYELQAADISGGLVTLRLRRRNNTATAKILYAIADDPFQWWANNLGPVDPN